MISLLFLKLYLNDTNLSLFLKTLEFRESSGGETGIRTPEPVAQLLPFQGSAIDHSAISPADW